MDGKYIVGMDGSAPARRAALWAARRAENEGVPLVLAFVAATDFGGMGHQYELDDQRHGAQILSQVAAEVREHHPALQVEEVVLHGSAAWSLAQLPRVHDVLVIGTHKTGYLHGRVLGSRSVQIAAAAPCTVAVIPDVDMRFRSGVIAGVDRVSTAGSVGRFAAHEAVRRGDELTLIQAIPLQPVPDSLVRAELPLTEAIAAASAAEPKLQIRSRVAHRQPAEALLNAARDKALLVLGPGSTDVSRSPIGSVLHDVLLNVNAPIIIARPAEERELVGPVTATAAVAND